MASSKQGSSPLSEPCTVTLVETSFGGRAAVHDFGGEARNGCLVFLPANGFHGYCYLPLAGHLRTHFHCYALDFPDQGDSSPAPPEENVFEYFVAATQALLLKFKLAGCIAVGHSSGGLTAIMTELRHPGSFSSLYLYEPVIHPDDAPWNDANGINPIGRVAVRRKSSFPSKAAALANFAGKPPFQTWLANALQCYVRHGLREQADGTALLRCSPQAEYRCYNAVDGACQLTWPHVASLKLPITVACGMVEPTAMFAQVERAAEPLVASVSSAHLERYEHLKHLGPMENPAFIASRVMVHFHAAQNTNVWNSIPKQSVLGLARL